MQHFLHKNQFDAVLGTRPVARTEHFFAHFLRLQPSSPTLTTAAPNKPIHPSPLFRGDGFFLGVMTPKRHAKRAVTRNAIKRQIYALGLALSTQHSLPPGACLVRLRSSFDRQQFVSASSNALKQVVRTELQQLFEQVLKHVTPPSNP